MLKTTAVTLAVTALTAGALTTTATATTTATTTAEAPVVRTDKGVLRGTVTETARTFQGIPYAAPPTGPRRWAPPAPAPAWRGLRDVTKPGTPCAQSGAIPIKGPKSETEDCLFLNVTTPRTTPRTATATASASASATDAARPRPVMVWLHGGDHEDGEGAMYGSERFAAQGDAVVVTGRTGSRTPPPSRTCSHSRPRAATPPTSPPPTTTGSGRNSSADLDSHWSIP